MSLVDWRELYAQNRAAIADAGVRLPAMNVAPLTETLVPRVGEASDPHPLAMPHSRGPLATPRRNQPAKRSTLRRGPGCADRALLHVPAGVDPSVPAAVVMMLHGCTQDPATFAAATAMNQTADRHGFVVIYPGQPRAHNAQGCWNWFLPEHQQRGAGEPRVLADIARGLMDKESGQAVDPKRIFIAGLSSGGAMALILAACYPDVFAAVAIHSGLPYGAADNAAAAFAVMGRARADRAPHGTAIQAAMGEHARPVPSMVIHGTADRTVAPGNARHILAQSMQANHLAAPHTCAHHPAKPSDSWYTRAEGGLRYTHSRWIGAHDALMHESIEVEDLGHAWSGGTPGGSFTDPRGPSATDAIWAFFAQSARPGVQTAAGAAGDTTTTDEAHRDRSRASQPRHSSRGQMLPEGAPCGR
jgi:poly(hydroxyalkanoate) depolymerase family esterase